MFLSFFSLFSDLALAIKLLLDSLFEFSYLSFNFFAPRVDLTSFEERVYLPYNKASEKCLYDFGKE